MPDSRTFATPTNLFTRSIRRGCIRTTQARYPPSSLDPSAASTQVVARKFATWPLAPPLSRTNTRMVGPKKLACLRFNSCLQVAVNHARHLPATMLRGNSRIVSATDLKRKHAPFFTDMLRQSPRSKGPIRQKQQFCPTGTTQMPTISPAKRVRRHTRRAPWHRRACFGNSIGW